jgi:hypothetical protein
MLHAASISFCCCPHAKPSIHINALHFVNASSLTACRLCTANRLPCCFTHGILALLLLVYWQVAPVNELLQDT